MTGKTQISPRAAHWRALKVAKADRLRSMRALALDPQRRDPAQPQPIKQRLQARTFWQRVHPWADQGGRAN